MKKQYLFFSFSLKKKSFTTKHHEMSNRMQSKKSFKKEEITLFSYYNRVN